MREHGNASEMVREGDSEREHYLRVSERAIYRSEYESLFGPIDTLRLYSLCSFMQHLVAFN